jgi:Lipase (class 3)
VISDAALARITLAVYSDPLPPGPWCGEWRKDGAWCAVWREGDVDVVVFRGSVTLLDWIEDADAAIRVVDPEIGECAAGFLIGMRAVQAALDATAGRRVVCTGHSLGAAHATLYAAHRCAIGLPPEQLVVFGEPKSIGAHARSLLASVPYVRSYRNRHDPVYLVPPDIPAPLYHCCPTPTPLNERPAPGALDLVADHSMALYATGVAKTEAELVA